jgi:prevent-host-death family protein
MEIGLRELRQNASELVRRAEAGETVVVTVSGRPAAHLVAAPRRQWRPASELQALSDLPADEDWSAERELLDDRVSDPFAR